MEIPLQITFRDIPPARIAEDWIRDEVAKLETFYNRPIACRVAVELPHRHHRRGSVFHIRVDLTLPGGQIVVARQPALGKRLQQTGESTVRKHLELRPEHKDLRLAINDAFKVVARQLRDYARRQRGDVKTHRVNLPRIQGELKKSSLFSIN